MRAPTSRMSRRARVLTLVASLLLGLLYVTPLWSVRLVAPQYPEGLGMKIMLSTIEGVKEHDLRNINALNHYIGMKAIEPDAIPELQYMPWIAAGLIATGLLVATLGSRRLLVGWTVGFAALGVAGLYDFWRWSYDYGHNLDLENAIIVVPGMSYQPPLIGTKQLLNFTATSLPDIGGVIAGLAMLMALIAIYMSRDPGRNSRHPAPGARLRADEGSALGSSGRHIVATLALLLVACAASAPTIEFGHVGCAECRMVISDRRFGAVIQTKHGRQLHFDSIDCLNKYTSKNGAAVSKTWLVDAARPGTLIASDSAIIEESETLHPPMGKLVAYGR